MRPIISKSTDRSSLNFQRIRFNPPWDVAPLYKKTIFEHDHHEHLKLLPRARLLEKSLVVVMTCAAGQRPVGQRVWCQQTSQRIHVQRRRTADRRLRQCLQLGSFPRKPRVSTSAAAFRNQQQRHQSSEPVVVSNPLCSLRLLTLIIVVAHRQRRLVATISDVHDLRHLSIHTYIHTYIQIYIAPKIVRTNLRRRHRMTRRYRQTRRDGF